MDSLIRILKPVLFKPTDRDDPEQLLQDWVDYVEQFVLFLDATGADGVHTQGHNNCGACKKYKSMIRLIGGKEVELLFKHVGQIRTDDTWDQTLTKVKEGITKQTNQAVARHKLFTQLSQGEKTFAAWFPRVKEQVTRCDFMGYNGDNATRDAILFQTMNTKLQQKILAEDLDMEKNIKLGLALEQSKKKVEMINAARGERKEDDRIAKLEEEV